VIVQVRGSTSSTQSAVFIFNTGEYPIQRTFYLSALGLSSPAHFYDWTAMRAWEQPVDHLAVTLQPHDGALLFLDQSPFISLPFTLP
jgi:hypothetical protein